ncbi:MAG: biotin/lipoyl-binding protein [Oscillatoriales cyanobacterium SM2_2_1]|nr:biotin/lipoyl-binding protein [Oscillatoriales cyanobacterium SM2_2_1]
MSVFLVKVRYLPLMATAVVAIVRVGLFRWFDNSSQSSYQSSAQTSPEGDRVSALGRLEPNGEVIEVFAPTSIDGARVEVLKVKQGQMLRRGETIAILDTYARRQAALAEAQRQVAIAQARLAQVEAGAKDGEIAAQERVAQRLAVELETEVSAQEATIARLNAELTNAELENRRFRFLQSEGAVSASLRDNRQLTADVVRQQPHFGYR